MTSRNKNILLFLTAFLQVSLVSMNVVFISQKSLIPMLITGFGISLLWTLNVKRVAFGEWRERIIYSSGAMIGTGFGYYFANYLIKLL
jgi:hypothetical protein